MTDSGMMTILHVSDFHFSKRRAKEQEIVVRALEQDLKSICIGHRKPDLILFTGDLVNAAGLDGHDEAYDALIDQVSTATGCSDERIFILPGNHDVQWQGLEVFSNQHHEWRSLLGTPNESNSLNELYSAGEFEAPAAAKFANYNELDRYLRGSAGDERVFENAFVCVDHVAALNADVVRFNTALLSTGGHKDFEKDEGNLAVPEYAVIDAVKALKPSSLRIILTHHPLSMLSEQSARYLTAEFERHGNLHLFGHMHDPQPKSVTGLKGSLLCDQAGALFTSRKEFYNGYALITLDRSAGYSETLIRSYFKDRDEFDEGIDVIAGGRWYPSQEARQHFRKLATPVDEKSLRAFLAGPALEALQTRERTVGSDGDLHSRFVDPPLRRTFFKHTREEEGRTQVETSISLGEIVSSATNLIIYARPEYGRTCLLKEVRYRQLSQAQTVPFPRVPSLIDFVDITNNADNMLRRARSECDLLPPGIEFETLLKLGHVTVLVDDVQFDDLRRMRILREFVARYPKALYILSSPFSSAQQFGAAVDPEMPVRFDFVEVQEFRRNDMRQLLSKDDRCTNVEEWLDRLQKEIREINLPFTAANGVILIEILSDKYNFTPINRSVLMEQFVDATLRKAALEQSRRDVFDYTNKIDLLSHVAAWMVAEEQYIPAREALRAEMKAYIDARGLNVSIDSLLAEFHAARIFINRSDERISFRYRGVLEYFIAVRMSVDSDFKQWIMDESRYLRFVNEILYYAGKVRNDAKLITEVAGRHVRVMSQVMADIGDLDLAQLETLQVPRDKDDVDGTMHEIAQPPLTKEEKDEELEAEFPKDEENRQEVFRPKVSDDGTTALLSLMLYSGLIKNMELIADKDKRKHLSTVWRSWSMVLVSSLRFAPRLAKERRIRINGVRYEVQAPQSMADSTLLRQMALRLPNAHIRLISNTMGTEKLERQLSEPSLQEHGEPLIFEFFRTGLLSDLRLSGTPGAIETLVGRLKNNHYLLWSLVVHVAELRRLDRIREQHFKALENTLAGAIALLKGGTRDERQREKRKQLARLAKDRLLLTMKPDREKS